MLPPSESLRIIERESVVQAMILTTMPAVRLETPRASVIFIWLFTTLTSTTFGERFFEPSTDLFVEILWLVVQISRSQEVEALPAYPNLRGGLSEPHAFPWN